jgi:TonB family protein
LPAFAQTPAKPSPTASEASAPAPVTLKVKPRFLSGDEAEFPADAKALGHHGTVMIGFEIDSSGTVTSSYVKHSSGSALLDASALATSKTARFSPAIDASGTPMSLKFQAPYKFYQSKSSEPGGGFVLYRCLALTAERDWWDSTHPDSDGNGEKDENYQFLPGLRVMTYPGGMMAGLRDGMVTKAHEVDWDKARKKCRANPDELVVNQLEQRDILLAMAKRESARPKR